MNIKTALLISAICLSGANAAEAQNALGGHATRVQPVGAEDQKRIDAAFQRSRQEAASGNPDVLLDVPNLSVEQITLDVQNLKVRINLDARLGNLLNLNAGADASIDKVKLDIKGVKAQALLKVRLDTVAAIIDRTLTTVDRNPQMVDRLLSTVDNTVNTVGNVANTALAPNGVLSQTVNTLGQTVNRTLDTTGNILEKTLDKSGNLLNSKSVGNLLNLPVLKETTNALGQTVKQVTDTSGKVVEFTLDSAGNITNPHVLSGR